MQQALDHDHLSIIFDLHDARSGDAAIPFACQGVDVRLQLFQDIWRAPQTA